VLGDPKVTEEIRKFFALHGVKSVIMTDGNLGCPHEEGIDFPRGRDCPFCPFWAGKQGTARSDDLIEWDDEDEEEDDEDDEGTEHGDLLTENVAGSNPDADEGNDDDAYDYDGAFSRAEQILGDADLDLDQAVEIMLEHLRANLVLPCEVTGGEDFQWEEPYVVGGLLPKEYKRLKKTQPSYTDTYQLLSIDRGRPSEWMMFDEDICARVRRVSDGKVFILGLAELDATDTSSRNFELLRDYRVWFVNSR